MLIDEQLGGASAILESSKLHVVSVGIFNIIFTRNVDDHGLKHLKNQLAIAEEALANLKKIIGGSVG